MTTNREIDLDARCTVTSTAGQVISLARLVRQAANRHERRWEKSTFVPEPGHRDAAKATIDRYDVLFDALLDAAGVDELVDSPRRSRTDA